eukprot:TRINITY_DN11651_c0_g1_i1.p1 TRINITY_DN11651_c0_g1~~TRINITY_DN11651_c0_g1_i1.p1  ORF type:complete len:888 (+),score=219.38 TRINITY_DN11651_c0_g1_i1:60-2666(+)
MTAVSSDGLRSEDQYPRGHSSHSWGESEGTEDVGCQWALTAGHGSPDTYEWSGLLRHPLIYAPRSSQATETASFSFRNQETGDVLSIPLHPVRHEAFFLTQIRRHYRGESAFRMVVGRLVELCQEMEQKPLGVVLDEEPYLTDRSGRILQGVRNFFIYIGGKATADSGFDFVFLNMDPAHLQSVSTTRRLLELELYYSRFPLEMWTQSPWSGGQVGPTQYSVLRAAHDAGIPRSTLAQLRKKHRAGGIANADLLKAAQRTWELCLMIVAYAHLTKDPAVMQDSATADLMDATQVLCQLCAAADEAPAVSIPPDAFDAVALIDKSQLLGEPSGPYFWRVVEFASPGTSRYAHEPEDTARVLKRDPEEEATVLVNNDGCCWLNSVLVALFHIPETRGAIMRADPSHSSTIDALQTLFAYMTPGNALHRFVSTSRVKREVLAAVERNGGASEAHSYSETGLSDACELLTIIPSVLDAETKGPAAQGSSGDLFQKLFLTELRSVPLKPAEDDEPKHTTEYPLFVNVSSEKPDAVRDMFYREDGTCLYDSLALLLLQSFETAGHSFQVISTDPPPVLCVNVRRKQWDRVKGRPYHSEKEIDVPTTLNLAFLMDGEDKVAARRALMQAEEKLAQLAVYDPLELYGVKAAQKAAASIPASLREACGDTASDRIMETVAALSKEASAMSEVRKGLIESTCADIHNAFTTLQGASPGEPMWYTLAVCICYSEGYGRGHYWAYVCRDDGQWLRCDDRPSYGEDLAEFKVCSEAEALHEAHTTATCLIFRKGGGEDAPDDEPAVSRDLLEHIQAGNNCIEQLLELCGLPRYPSTQCETEDDFASSSAPRLDSDGHFDYGVHGGAHHEDPTSSGIHGEAV